MFISNNSCSIEMSNDVKLTHKTMETTVNESVSSFIPKYIAVNLPDQTIITKRWQDAKNEVRQAIKEEGHNPEHWPEGAKTRSTKIEDLEYFVCNLEGERFERAEYYEQFFTDHTLPDRKTIADIAKEAISNKLCAMEGFKIDVECRVDFEYRDEDGEIVQDWYGSDREPSEHYVSITAFEHKPIKCGSHELRLFNAYQHFMIYINLDHLSKVAPWGKNLTDHFISKLKGRISASKANHVRPDVIVLWVQDMTPHNQAVLFDYIYSSILRRENRHYGESDMVNMAENAKEAWTFGIEEGEIAAFLKSLDLKLLEHYNSTDLEERYFTSNNGEKISRVNGTHCIALAVKVKIFPYTLAEV